MRWAKILNVPGVLLPDCIAIWLFGRSANTETRVQPGYELAFSRRSNLRSAANGAYSASCPAPLERFLDCSLPG